jgi:hypothetical protein
MKATRRSSTSARSLSTTGRARRFSTTSNTITPDLPDLGAIGLIPSSFPHGAARRSAYRRAREQSPRALRWAVGRGRVFRRRVGATGRPDPAWRIAPEQSRTAVRHRASCWRSTPCSTAGHSRLNALAARRCATRRVPVDVGLVPGIPRRQAPTGGARHRTWHHRVRRLAHHPTAIATTIDGLRRGARGAHPCGRAAVPYDEARHDATPSTSPAVWTSSRYASEPRLGRVGFAFAAGLRQWCTTPSMISSRQSSLKRDHDLVLVMSNGSSADFTTNS